MIDLYYWPTPNGHKITVFLEESGLEYRLNPVDINNGEQFSEEFLAISPNGRMPAIVDHSPSDGEGSISVFESGAILQYLADKTAKFLPQSRRERTEVVQWLMWQMGGLGPMAGQKFHFVNSAPEVIPYAIKRYETEVQRLLAVLNQKLSQSEWLTKDYSIADMAIYPWIKLFEDKLRETNEFPNIIAWMNAMQKRSSVIAAYQQAERITN